MMYPANNGTTTKQCPGCGRTKPAQSFHRDRHRPDGLYHICRQCRRPVQAATARRRRARKAAYRAAYEAQFPAENRERKRRARAALPVEERRELWRYEYAQRDKVQIAKRVRERRHAVAAAQDKSLPLVEDKGA